MEQTTLVRGMGLFATLLGIQQWLVLEANIEDFFFIIFATALLMILEANMVGSLPEKSKNSSKEIWESSFLDKLRLFSLNFCFNAIL